MLYWLFQHSDIAISSLTLRALFAIITALLIVILRVSLSLSICARLNMVKRCVTMVQRRTLLSRERLRWAVC